MSFKVVLLLCCMAGSTTAWSAAWDKVSIDCSEKPNEHYACGSACQTECSTLGEVCMKEKIDCNNACFCNPGFARDASGTCIPKANCPKKNCFRPNEHYECGSACQTVCSTLGMPCTILNKKCNDACYCNEGYARDSTGVCIPKQDCPN